MTTRFLACFCLVVISSTAVAEQPIDRRDLVQRHHPLLREADPLAPLSVGNGEFAFTADVTGLQTFPEEYAGGIPLSTQAHWGWHSFPNPEQYRLKDALVEYDAHDRTTVYASDTRSEAGQWLRQNPHRLGLARVGFELFREDGTTARIDDLQAVVQTLDLWSGTLISSFELDGKPVRVRTTCHPRLDLLAVRVESPLIRQNRLKVVLRFSYGAGRFGKEPEDWTKPEVHRTVIVQQKQGRVDLARTLDAFSYRVSVAHSPDSRFAQRDRHCYELAPDDSERKRPTQPLLTSRLPWRGMIFPFQSRRAQWGACARASTVSIRWCGKSFRPTRWTVICSCSSTVDGIA